MHFGLGIEKLFLQNKHGTYLESIKIREEYRRTLLEVYKVYIKVQRTVSEQDTKHLQCLKPLKVSGKVVY